MQLEDEVQVGQAALCHSESRAGTAKKAVSNKKHMATHVQTKTGLVEKIHFYLLSKFNYQIAKHDFA